MRALRVLSVAGAFRLIDPQPLLGLPRLEELCLADCVELRSYNAMLDKLYQGDLRAANTLRSLDLSGCDLLDPPAPMYLARNCPELTCLRLRGFQHASSPDDGLGEILRGSFAAQVIELDLSACSIDAKQFGSAIQQCLSLRRLKAELMPSLTADDLGDALASIRSLEQLHLSNPAASGIRQQSQDDSLRKVIQGCEDTLVDLSIHGWYGLSSEAVETACMQLTRLQRLDASWVPSCTAESLRMIMQGCPGLECLVAVCAGRIDEMQVAHLRRDFPGCRMLH